MTKTQRYGSMVLTPTMVWKLLKNMFRKIQGVFLTSKKIELKFEVCHEIPMCFCSTKKSEIKFTNSTVHHPAPSLSHPWTWSQLALPRTRREPTPVDCWFQNFPVATTAYRSFYTWICCSNTVKHYMSVFFFPLKTCVEKKPFGKHKYVINKSPETSVCPFTPESPS